MGVGAVMCWARLTCFYAMVFSPLCLFCQFIQLLLELLSVPNISVLNVWVLFGQLQLEPTAQAFLLGIFCFM